MNPRVVQFVYLFIIVGACQDGSDAILTGQPFVNPPCADNSFPDLSKCACADGTALPARPPRRG